MNFRAVKRRGNLDTNTSATDESSSDGGFSLVEVVMTVVLMGIVIIPLMNAAITGIKASSSTRRVAELQTVLLNAADRVNRANVTCQGYLIYVQAAAQTKGWSKDQAAATYEWYEPGTTAGVAGTWHSGACAEVDGAPPQNLVQRVTITMTSPEASVSRSIQVVKSDV